MAKFRDSMVDSGLANEIQPEVSRARSGDKPPQPGRQGADRTIGDIISELRSLDAEQVEKILKHQREKGVRFGEAAIELGFASREDVLYALAQQFQYPYAPSEHRLSPEVVAFTEPFGPRAESFRALRSQLMMRLYTGDTSRSALAVVSPSAGDGKTYCAANLAVSLAQLGGRTLLVDADLRGPRLHELFGIESGRPGLSSILAGRGEGNVIRQVGVVPSLFVLPVGTTPPNPLELVERPAFGLLMRELVSKFDHVVVDTPAAAYGADGAVIAARCGAALVVARQHKGKVAALQEMLGTVSGSTAKIVGVVMNEF